MSLEADFPFNLLLTTVVAKLLLREKIGFMGYFHSFSFSSYEKKKKKNVMRGMGMGINEMM